MFISESLSTALAHWEHYNPKAVDNVLFIFRDDDFCVWLAQAHAAVIQSFFDQIIIDLKSAMHFSDFDLNEANLIRTAVTEATGHSLSLTD